MQRRFVPEIESLRGLAAFAVLLGHWYLFLSVENLLPWPLSDGAKRALFTLFDPQPAVMIFFVISGLVLGIQLARNPVTGAPAYGAYLLRRIFRLWPAVWAAAVLSYLLSWHTTLAQPDPVLLWKTGAYFNPTLNPSLWSLRVELLISVIFPVMAWVFTKGGPIGHVIAMVCLSALTFTEDLPFFTAFLVFFYAGLLVGAYADRVAAALKPWQAWTLLAVAVAGYFLAPQFPLTGAGGDLANWHGWLLLEVAPCSVIVGAAYVGLPKLVSRFLCLAPMRFLGRISYSLYLVHAPILLALNILTYNRMGASSFAQCLLTLALGVAVTIAVATALYYAVELPFIRLGRVLSRKVAGTPPAPVEAVRQGTG